MLPAVIHSDEYMGTLDLFDWDGLQYCFDATVK